MVSVRETSSAGLEIDTVYIMIGLVKKPKEEYLYSVAWSEEDEAFVARVAEFPSLAAHGDTQEEALGEIKKVVKFVLSDLKAN